MTDADTKVLNWLLERTTYLEHSRDEYGWWPHLSDCQSCDYEKNKVGLSLREYVEARIKEESET